MLGTLVWAQPPVAAFTSNVTSGCAPLGVTFTDQSTNHPTSWTWSFGNGQISNKQSPTIGFFAAGTYTVTLIVKNADGTSAVRDSNYITVYASPAVSFGLNHLACSPADIQFQQFSQPGQGTITSYVWNFGDGSPPGGDAAPIHLYTQPGYYNVSLTVTNSGGCTSSVTDYRTLRLVDGVQTNFAWNETGNTCTAPFSLNFLNQTAGPATMTYNWSFGGGAAPTGSSSTNPTGIAYPSAGSFPVTLIATSSLGCADTLTQNVPLTSNSPVINGPTAGCVNTSINFSNGTHPAPIASSWSWGDGSQGSNDSAATHTYTSAGTYTLTLTNTYANCTTTTTGNITISAGLIPTFTATPVSACKAPLTVQFTDQTTPVPTQWSWKFGDGQTSIAQNPTHTYTTAGSYTVTLNATVAGGCQDSISKNNFVVIQAPSVTIGGTLGACIASSATFNTINPVANANAVDGVASYAWTATGSNEGSSTAANPSFTYPSTGNYTISVIITTNGGCTATASSSVQIGTPLIPSFTISPPSPVCNSTVLTFTSTTPGNPQTYDWNFGDHSGHDSISTHPTVTHQYGFYGPHIVTLTVYNNGCPQQANKTIQIEPPFAFFSYTLGNTGCSNRSLIQFNDSSYISTNTGLYGAVSWSWNFGDPASGANNTSSQENPTHQYPAPTGTPQTYTVTLTVTQGTCPSTISDQVTIGNITASFTSVPPGPACRNAQVTFTSTSTPVSLIGGYSWQVDAQPPTAESSSPTYQTSFTPNGTHSMTLIAFDQNGCPSTPATSNIQINGPIAAFNVPATGGACQSIQMTFTDASIASPSAIASWSWNFGDGSPASILQNATHIYADTGYFQPVLTVTDAAGCIDTTSRTLQITQPVANFGVPDSFYCPNEPLTFIDSSQGYNLVESWNFGDGSGPQPTPVHSFTNNGQTYNVTLTATDKNNCTNTITKPVRIQSPIAAFNIADTTGICVPLQTIFTAAGQYYDSLYWEFGDGQTSTLAPSTSHFYNSLDTFTATLVVQGPGGCLDSTSRKVYLTNPNTTVFNFTPKTACDSIVVQFTILPPPYTTFNLQFGDGLADSSGNEAPVHTYRIIDSYLPSLNLTDATGCIVTVNNGGVVVLGAVPFFTASPAAFCDSGTVTFNDYTITNNGVLSKTFSFGDGSSASQSPPLTNPFDTTHYYNTTGSLPATLSVITLANCTASYTDTIRVYQTPQAAISDSGYLCAGLLQFLGKLAFPDVDTLFWHWDFGNGQTANVQNPLVNTAAGTYTVSLVASTSFGCADTTSTSVTINPNPTIKGPKEINTPVGIPVTIPFSYSPDVTTWSWLPIASLSCADCPNPVATLIFAQTYSVLVTDSNNCTDTASILINTICNEGNYFFPNTFSPNGDGVNDYFYPRGSGLYNIQSLTIFNRWGQIVFQRKNFPANSETMGWDGTFNGKPAPMDAYVYIAEVICVNAQVVAIHGNVTLVR
jgi:gliding motility-associated-like protein